MRKLSLLALVLGFAACRGDDTSGDDTPGNDADPGKSEYTIQEIQNDAMPPCDIANPSTCVNLTIKGVVVTAIDTFGAKTGDFWVQEPEGGPFSGVQVFGAPIDQVAALKVGDIVDITNAQKSEFALTSDTSGNKLTELEPVEGGTMTVTKIMSGTPLEPTVVDALVIGQMTDFNARAAEWEKWEGVLVKINNPQSFSATTCITSMGNCNDTSYERFDVTGDIQVQSALAAMPAPKVKNGDCLGSVTGVMTYFFDYQILPRSTAEIGTGGTACPKENMAAECGDGIDNDGNGFKDCADNQCITAAAACRTVTTINAIQTATTPPTGGIELQDVCVSGLSRPSGMAPATSKNIWVQSSDTVAAANEGVFVFGDGSDYGAFTPGKKVNIIGKVIEFNDSMGTGTLTEVSAMSVTLAAGTCTPTPVLNQTAASLTVDANGEPMEGVLIQMANVRVTALGTTANNFVSTVRQSGTDFKADDDAYRWAAGDLNKCYSTINGFWSYNVYDNTWIFLPRLSPTGTGPDGVLAANQSDCN